MLLQRTQASTSDCLSNTIAPTSASSTSLNQQIDQLAPCHQAFAFKLYRVLQQEKADDNVADNNLFVSPFSITLALAMTFNGTKGQTQTEMAQALELAGVTPEILNQANLALKESLENADPQISLSIANSLWIKEGFPIKSRFSKEIDKYYQAEVSELDFEDSNSLKTINEWVQTHTQQKIKKIIDELKPTDVLILMNALYFNGKWQAQFNSDETREQPFFLSNGQTKQHPLMYQKGDYHYYENKHFQAVSLPYGSGRMSLYIFLPRPNSDLSSFHQRLTTENWDKWLREFQLRDGVVEIPRFKIESTFSLKETLSSLGIGEIFDPNKADFSALTDEPNVSVDRMKHKTFIEVNETGTEAAATTAVVARQTSAIAPELPPPFQMKVDRPFFSALRDNETGTLLFLGAVTEPK